MPIKSNYQRAVNMCHLQIKTALLMYLRFAMVGLPRIIAPIRQWKAIISLSRWRERVGVRVGLIIISVCL